MQIQLSGTLYQVDSERFKAQGRLESAKVFIRDKWRNVTSDAVKARLTSFLLRKL